MRLEGLRKAVETLGEKWRLMVEIRTGYFRNTS